MKTLFVVFVVFLISASLGFATTVRVPSEQPTIQAGIDVAVNGDTVLVADGIYTGEGNRDIDFIEKTISLISENGPRLTTIDCQGDSLNPHRGLYFDSYTESELNGFTVMNGFAELGGAALIDWHSKPIIKNCIFSKNYAIDWGGGVSCLSYSSPTITNCILKDNNAIYGGGIDLYQSYPVISNCIVTKNTAVLGGGVSLYQSAPTITNCTLADNIGGGVYGNYSSPEITNCIVWENENFEININFGLPFVTYSDIEGGWTGEGNINTEPGFVSYKGFNFLLPPKSPCIDAGDPSIKDRLYDWHPKWPAWYPDGARSDMGAYGGPGNGGWLN